MTKRTSIHKAHFFSKYILGILSLSFAIFLGGCTEEKKQELKAPLRQVRSQVVESGTGVYETSFSGRLHASRETSYSFKVPGTIQDIKVNVGDSISKGDVLAKLDPSTYALQAQQSKASLAEAQSESRNAKANYARVKKLYIGGNVSRSDLDNARTSSDSAAAAVQSARKTLEIARLNLSYTQLKADEDCSIASIDVEESENVAQGTQIFYTTCGKELEVKLDIPESVIASIKKGMGVKVTLSVLEGKTYAGKVHEVGVSSIQGGTTFPVTIILTDPHKDDLQAGLSADVSFSIMNDKKSNGKTFIVPPFAIGEDHTGRFVFVLKTAEGHTIIKRRPVTVGNVLPTGIEVVDGLSPGMRVVTAGVSVLRDGMEVKNSNER